MYIEVGYSGTRGIMDPIAIFLSYFNFRTNCTELSSYPELIILCDLFEIFFEYFREKYVCRMYTFRDEELEFRFNSE